jgi:hypothetical protein
VKSATGLQSRSFCFSPGALSFQRTSATSFRVILSSRWEEQADGCVWTFGLMSTDSHVISTRTTLPLPFFPHQAGKLLESCLLDGGDIWLLMQQAQEAARCVPSLSFSLYFLILTRADLIPFRHPCRYRQPERGA